MPKSRVVGIKENYKKRKGRVSILFGTIIGALISAVVNIRAYGATSLRPAYVNAIKPFYGMACPAHQQAIGDCRQQQQNNSSLIAGLPISLLYGRTSMERNKLTRGSWNHLIRNRKVKVVYTRRFGLEFQQNTNKLGCHNGDATSWEQRLFATYQWVFQTTLAEHPTTQSHFVFVEDDVMLLDEVAWREQLCLAQELELDFYSLFQTDIGSTDCMYYWGTQAFFISRRIMQRVIDAPTQVLCSSMPIDMYLASIGPWYVTTENIFWHHKGKRTKLPKDGKGGSNEVRN